jgi:hypothetical protein
VNYFQHVEHYFRSMGENPNRGDRELTINRSLDYLAEGPMQSGAYRLAQRALAPESSRPRSIH